MTRAAVAGRRRRPRCRPPAALRLLPALLFLAVSAGCGGSGAGPSATGSPAGGAARGAARGPAPTVARTVGAWDWRGFGHDAQHTFTGRTTLTEQTARTLRSAWFFRTDDAVTATPTVAAGTVYVGSWDGWFYAIDFATGRLRWKYHLEPQEAVTPYPGQKPRDIGSDGGLVTSSAWFEPAATGRPALVIFGGGYTLYALDAVTGKRFWSHAYTGFPGQPPSPATDGTRIMSSPVVSGGLVLFGVDADGEKGSRGYIVGASLDTGAPAWQFQTDAGPDGTVLNDGCGSVWSSGTLLPDLHAVVFSTADCRFSNPPPLQETVLALDVRTGTVLWTFRPMRADDMCDLDFGASANAGVDRAGRSVFVGVGSKDGTYYSLDPATGHQRWATNVVFGGFSGGFIASAAYDGTRVVGATALGDFGRFEKSGAVLCDPANPRDTTRQEPSVHAIDATTGAVSWQADRAASFGATTIAGGMSFNDPALSGPLMEVRDVRTGRLLQKVTLIQESWSGVASAGNALVVGEGTDYDYQPSGVEVLTPRGTRPSVPAG